MKYIICLQLNLIFYFSIGQINKIIPLDSISEVHTIPWCCTSDYDAIDCGDQLFWNLVLKNINNIPDLINSVTDTSNSKVFEPCSNGYLTKGDVSFVILQELVQDPQLVSLFDTNINKYCCGLWNYLKKDNRLREEFKNKLLNWYNDNKQYFVLITDNRSLTCNMCPNIIKHQYFINNK